MTEITEITEITTSITSGLAFGSEPLGDGGEIIVPDMQYLIPDIFSYALFGDDDKFDDWVDTLCHYN